jgi:hypothetical protein
MPVRCKNCFDRDVRNNLFVTNRDRSNSCTHVCLHGLRTNGPSVRDPRRWTTCTSKTTDESTTVSTTWDSRTHDSLLHRKPSIGCQARASRSLRSSNPLTQRTWLLPQRHRDPAHVLPLASARIAPGPPFAGDVNINWHGAPPVDAWCQSARPSLLRHNRRNLHYHRSRCRTPHSRRRRRTPRRHMQALLDCSLLCHDKCWALRAAAVLGTSSVHSSEGFLVINRYAHPFYIWLHDLDLLLANNF